MIVSFLILMIAFELLKESILKIIKPTTVEFSIIVILTLCLSIFVKFCLFLFNGKLAKKIKSGERKILHFFYK
jgi:divalent metal cation (Fe/Co/Zn/Cd) transporter